MPQSWQEGTEEPETNLSVPQQEEQLDATEDKDIVDSEKGIGYEGSEPKNEPVAQGENNEDPDKEYAKIELP